MSGQLSILCPSTGPCTSFWFFDRLPASSDLDLLVAFRLTWTQWPAYNLLAVWLIDFAIPARRRIPISDSLVLQIWLFFDSQLEIVPFVSLACRSDDMGVALSGCRRCSSRYPLSGL